MNHLADDADARIASPIRLVLDPREERLARSGKLARTVERPPETVVKPVLARIIDSRDR
jgi:hypothetical protein